MKKINKHFQKMEEHFDKIVDSIELDEKTIQMFSVLFGIAKKVNDKTMNKVVKDVDDFRKKEWKDNLDWMKENGCKVYEDEEIYDGLFDIDE